MTDKGIVSGLGKQADLVMFVFNMDDPLLGKNRFLRQAISAAIDRQAMIHTFFNDRALIAQGPIPPDIFGYDPNRKDPNGYDPARAKELMKKALEFEKARGRAAIPPIVHDIHNSTSARQVAEALVNDLKKIGLTLKIRVSTWPQLQERMARGDIQLTFYSWVADYPDPENFLRLLYSKNVSPGPNTANFRNAEYDRMFERMRDLPNNAERSELISGMVRLVQEETPWVFFNHRLAYPIRHDWVKNFKRNEMAPAQLKYLDIDLKRKQEALKKL
jgi:ABC-type transport system substrate-binding protein